eukprot:COSAG01_NODE_167_length_23239_cov_14.692457_10_plen_174_part_01
MAIPPCKAWIMHRVQKNFAASQNRPGMANNKRRLGGCHSYLARYSRLLPTAVRSTAGAGLKGRLPRGLSTTDLIHAPPWPRIARVMRSFATLALVVIAAGICCEAQTQAGNPGAGSNQGGNQAGGNPNQGQNPSTGAPAAQTCTDRIQNGDETGVDCGGSCTACPPARTSCTDR